MDQTDGISSLGPLICGLFLMILSFLCWPLPALLFYYCTTCDKEFHGDCRVLVGLDIPVAPAPMSKMAYIDERRAQARARREEMSAHCPLPTVLVEVVAGYVAELSYGLTYLAYFADMLLFLMRALAPLVLHRPLSRLLLRPEQRKGV
jgi:hypothetical protein